MGQLLFNLKENGMKVMREKKKRIAMIGHKFIPSRDGGVEVVVSNLAPHLAEIGYDVSCYNRTNKQFKKLRKSGELEKEYRGVHLIWTPTVDRRGLAAMTSSIFATVRAAFGRYDLIHFHTEGPCILCWLPRLFGKKIVVTIHGLDHMRQKWGRLASAYIMQGEKAAARHAHSIIVLSNGVRDYFREKYGRETVLIPNGIDPAEIKPACEITKQFGLSSREYILFLGRLVPEKGIHYLIKAYQMLQTDKKLVIVGGTSDTDDYVKQYVLPSDLEGMPLSLLEAMNYGCCCVTSDIGECVDVMDGCGFSFPHGNVEALRETLQDLCDHPDKVEAHRDEAKKVISSKYTWQDITTQTDKLYKSLLGD